MQFLVRMKWNFIFLVHTDDEYGVTTRDTFSEKSRENELCVHLEQTLNVKYANTSETTESAKVIINEVYKHISKGYDKSMSVVYLGYAEGLTHLLEAAENADKPAGSKISWIFSQGIGTDVRVIDTTDFSQTYGLAVSHGHLVHSDFKDYLIDVLQNKTYTPYADLKPEYLSAIGCDSSTVHMCHNLKQNNSNFLSSFIDSVLLTVTMLQDLHAQTCQGLGLCDLMKETLVGKRWYSLPVDINFRTKLNETYLPKAYQSRDRNLHFTSNGHVGVNAASPLEIYSYPDLLDTVCV